MTLITVTNLSHARREISKWMKIKMSKVPLLTNQPFIVSTKIEEASPFNHKLQIPISPLREGYQAPWTSKRCSTPQMMQHPQITYPSQLASKSNASHYLKISYGLYPSRVSPVKTLMRMNSRYPIGKRIGQIWVNPYSCTKRHLWSTINLRRTIIARQIDHIRMIKAQKVM
jgi:hypothetical protein